MFKTLTLGAIPALVLAAGLASPALAAPTPACADAVREVQTAWNAMYPMAMQQDGHQGIADALRLAKEACNSGDVVKTQQYLNVVRSHLAMPRHPAPHDL
ncbi:exported hypothetical protein [uncultured Alphaproteobacteria bacterium]|uniref:Uncharacterized protein n=1 Tax=uncultured Alphaproteobacteria bacterium TaxID=91750 RepID=A0A212KLU1_9PROT|nr:exported hypothetical protein [uncultured Alphaproteobacteria bacterium]